MKLQTIEKLLALLPDGPKKQKFAADLKARMEKPKSGGLHDVFEFAPKGHIRIEKIDGSGNVLGLLADQANLVVNGAEEILLRAFSGDPERTLYKVRIPNDESKIYHIGIDAISEVVDGVDQLKYAPNIFWKAVEDKDFKSSYAYRPKTLFLKEETSTQVGKKAFRIVKTPVSGAIPITSEIYSSSTNMFIGIGDGKNYEVDLADDRLTYTGSWATSGENKVSPAIGDKIAFEEKISNFKVDYLSSDKGGRIEIYVDNVLKNEIECYDAAAVVPVEKSFELSGLDHTLAHKIEIKFSAADAAIVNPEVAIAGIHFDALTKEMNGLIHELENFTKTFDTPTVYSTTNVAPFTTQLISFPVVPESLVVEYDGDAMDRVETKAEVAEGKYFADAQSGKLYFNRTLSGLLITYNVTGEQYIQKIASLLTADKVTHPITAEVPVGTIDGTNKLFKLAKKPLVAGTLAVTKVAADSTETLIASADVTPDLNAGTFTLKTAPVAGETLKVSYEWSEAAKTLDLPVKAATSVKVNGQAADKKVLTLAATKAEFGPGKFLVDGNKLYLSPVDTDGSTIFTSFEVLYVSAEIPGVATGYTRQIIEKPKSGIAYPWYQLDKGTISFIAEFPENVPNHNITIREMILADGPRTDDKIDGYSNYPVDAFSIVRVGETRKEVSTGIRVTWTITLLNKDGDPFYGGY
ncbi:DUF2460 domain-containing protein (plasmid) [Paenibacillus rhizovicinus]|uniref:DUF2460 domain-containing protein n=1 Tax=Paenibacillus rhizovicinus TaxID=2704463 RepID=A0A6C0PCY0_9BACL|nr:DUF2460 domain-containing protein [Paenibacillus rhizovicinus]QHW35672.1 DUF2460 domain-containing protein [Paenibacillus rhizovicinus]